MVFKWINKQLGNVFSKDCDGNSGKVKALLTEEIRLEGISSWFDEKEHFVLKALNDELRGVVSEIDEILVEINASASALETARLQNERIPVRERQMMEGNRSIYVSRIKRLVARLGSKLKSLDISPVSVSDFAEKALADIGETASALERPYAVLQFFFANEAKKAAAGLKKLSDSCKDILDLVSSDQKLADSKHIRQVIEKLLKDVDAKKLISSQISENNAVLSDVRSQKEAAEKELKLLEESELFRSFNDTKAELAVIESKINCLRENMYDLFYLINKPLRKFKASEDEALVARYAEDPINAVSLDSSLRIMDVLSRLRIQIVNSGIEVKDRLKPRVLEAIDAVKRDDLSAVAYEYRDLLGQLERAHKKLDSHPVMIEQNRIKCRISYAAESEKAVLARLSDLDSRINEFDIKKSVLELEKLLESLTGINVKINI